MSPGFQKADFAHMRFPAQLLIDYVRVYQRNKNVNIGCDPASHPTASYINRCGRLVSSTAFYREWLTTILRLFVICFLCCRLSATFLHSKLCPTLHFFVRFSFFLIPFSQHQSEFYYLGRSWVSLPSQHAVRRVLAESILPHLIPLRHFP